MNILIRLTAKSLVRFKCVSKFWTTLISDPYIKKNHLIHARNVFQNPKNFLLANVGLINQLEVTGSSLGNSLYRNARYIDQHSGTVFVLNPLKPLYGFFSISARSISLAWLDRI
ncbi:hypothetical protein BC332_29805 [Capsicum chinense]|nr:hypothetical protein BC332_29805 [Capsicum chinense]